MSKNYQGMPQPPKPKPRTGVFSTRTTMERWLSTLSNPTAIYLRDSSLNRSASNAFGLPDSKKMGSRTYTAWTWRQKAKFPRLHLGHPKGEFFLNFSGVDAILTVEFGGIRAMGNPPRMASGIQVNAIQRTVYSLVEVGLTV